MAEQNNIQNILDSLLKQSRTIGDIFSRTAFLKIAGGLDSVLLNKNGKQENSKVWSALLDSRLFWWFMLNTGKATKRLSKLTFKSVSEFPVPDSAVLSNSASLIEHLVDMIAWLNDSSNTDIFSFMDNDRVAANIGEILDMVVYEMYFEEYMKEQRIDVIGDLQGYEWSETVNASEIERFFRWFQQSDNMVRQKIMLLDTRSLDFIYRIHIDGNF